ncbi:MAG: hypothetical protein GY950_32485, partial [bacterium]|nr:hypothetical protein [bacterium]
YYPLSSVQKRLFTIDRLEGAGTMYSVSSVKIIEGNLDRDRVEEAFKRILARHGVFRTSFFFSDGEPVQRIHKYEDVEFQIQYENLSAGSPEEFDYKNRIKPFDLSRVPLLRVELTKLSADRHILMYDTHHIISDGASKGIIAKEFLHLYQGRELQEVKIQYRDFCQWLARRTVKAMLNRQETYWLKQFDRDIPVLNLPTDYPRPVPKGFEGASLSFKIGKDGSAGLKALATRENTTLFVVLLAVYNIFLAKICMQNDIIVGIPIAGRRHPGLNDIIGMFVNTLVLRNYPEGEKTFDDFLKQVKHRTLDAFENQDY